MSYGRIYDVVQSMDDRQLRLLVEVTNRPVMIASVLQEAYQELSGRDNERPGTFNQREPPLESTLDPELDPMNWISYAFYECPPADRLQKYK